MSEIEITSSDLAVVTQLFGHLETIAGIEGITSIEIQVTIEGQWFLLGYGENGEPAILSVSLDDPTAAIARITEAIKTGKPEVLRS